jgi:hypothetical protein
VRCCVLVDTSFVAAGFTIGNAEGLVTNGTDDFRGGHDDGLPR